MSYYKVRSVAFKKSLGEIWVTCADSSYVHFSILEVNMQRKQMILQKNV